MGDYGTHLLQPHYHDGILFQVPWAGPIGIRWILAGSDSELAESTGELGASVMGAWTGGGGYADFGNVLYCDGLGGAHIWVGVMNHIHADW